MLVTPAIGRVAAESGSSEVCALGAGLSLGPQLWRYPTAPHSYAYCCRHHTNAAASLQLDVQFVADQGGDVVGVNRVEVRLEFTVGWVFEELEAEHIACRPAGHPGGEREP
jgi:hypothetical protein